MYTCIFSLNITLLRTLRFITVDFKVISIYNASNTIKATFCFVAFNPRILRVFINSQKNVEYKKISFFMHKVSSKIFIQYIPYWDLSSKFIPKVILKNRRLCSRKVLFRKYDSLVILRCFSFV